MHWNWASLYWLCWIVLGFCPVEFYALWSGHAEWTLSEQVWHLEGLTSKNGAVFWNPLSWSIPHFLVACFVIWLAVHFIDHAWHSMTP